ncbi:MAG TPA: potassium channel protein [Elusimicrobiota bacterium]|jgi:voltage-gated potassium channel|nr:potassium channel protein [Elusimicrobiota bacterium]
MVAESRKRLAWAALAVAALFVIGTAGYVLIEGWSWFDAFYMTTITLATIGYGEVHPLSNHGRAFTIGLAVTGFGAVAYSLSAMTAFIVEGELSDVLRRRKMTKKIAALSGHYIVCGGGNTGRTILEELRSTGRDFVMLENDPVKASQMEEEGVLVLRGDALSDESLQEAGIERAAGLFCALANDRDNVFLVLSARSLNARLRIVSEIHDEGVRPKLLRGGADAVVSSFLIGGLRMASEMVRPAAVSFLDSMIRDKGSSYRFEELEVPSASALVGKPAGEVHGAGDGGALLLAIRRPQAAAYEINPPSERPLAAGEVLVVIGNADQVGQLKRRLSA